MARRRAIAGLVAGVGSAALIAGVGAVPAVAGDLSFERLAGPSGVETSIAVAKHTWGADWKVVYVASNRNPVDALPAATIGDGPVVLTDGKSLNLGGVKPGKIVLLGGTGAVPQGIEDQAKATGAEVIRLKGADRNATAAEIARQWGAVNGTPKNVYVTKNVGSGSPDAVAASVLRDGPILTFTNDASANALAGIVSELKAEKVTALGGTGVVSDAVVNGAAAGKATARLAGANRYETAFEIAKHAKNQKSGSNVYLASGTALKDAMVAGAAKDGVILLSTPNGEGVKAKADTLGAAKLIVIGGTGVMPDATVQAAATGVVPQPAQPTQPAQPKQQPQPSDLGSAGQEEATILQGINELRVMGLAGELTRDSQLDAFARDISADMAKRNEAKLTPEQEKAFDAIGAPPKCPSLSGWEMTWSGDENPGKNGVGHVKEIMKRIPPKRLYDKRLKTVGIGVAFRTDGGSFASYIFCG